MNTQEELTKEINQDENIENFPRWYQHPTIHNKNLHFCCVIDKMYLDILGGFDEDYKKGICYEDDDFIFRIKEILKLNIISVPLTSNVGVVHLYHGRSAGVNICESLNVKQNSIYEKYCLNQKLFNYQKNKNKSICIPKLIHYYWDNFEKLSYMNLYSLKSSIYYHPDYIHIIWCPINPQNNITWNENCNKIWAADTMWKKYVNEIESFKNVRIIYKNISKFIGVDENMSEIHKSDLFRYKIIHQYGGIWSDLDIVYIKSITEVVNFNFDTINFLCKGKNNALYMPIGLLLSKRKAFLFKKILIEAIKNYDPKRYQCTGAETLAKIFLNNNATTTGSKMKEDNLNLCKYEDNLLQYKDPKIINEKNILLNEDIYMALDWTKINNLFYDRGVFCEKTNTVGYHWFNGSSKTKEYLKEITNYNIPKIFKGVLFNERNKFNKQLSKITYFDIQIDNSGKFFKNKLNIYIKIINILTKSKPFDYESINIRDYYSYSEMPKFNYIDNNLTIFDELSYAYLLSFYTYTNRENKLKIEHFIKNCKYICFFCEIFKNDQLQTIGNKVCNLDFAVSFFKNAYIML